MKRHRQMKCLVALLVIQFLLAGEDASAQRRFRRRARRYYWGYYHAVDAIAARVHAQSDLIDALGVSAVNHAQAERIRQSALTQKIDNWHRYFERRNKIKRLLTEERQLEELNRRNRERRSANRIYARMRDFPEYFRGGIPSATALNWLLYRLKGTALAHSRVSNSSAQDLPEFELSPDVLRHLKLREDAPNGASVNFMATDGLPDLRWPYELDQPYCASERAAFEKTRADLVQTIRGGASDRQSVNATLNQLQSDLEALKREFWKHNTRRYRQKGGLSVWTRCRTAQDFLQSLQGELDRFLSSNDLRSVFDGSRRFDEGSLIELLQFMSRNGLVFAPAAGSEDHGAYHTLFRLMLDLYVTVADDDPALKARTLAEDLALPPTP